MSLQQPEQNLTLLILLGILIGPESTNVYVENTPHIFISQEHKCVGQNILVQSDKSYLNRIPTERK